MGSSGCEGRAPGVCRIGIEGFNRHACRCNHQIMIFKGRKFRFWDLCAYLKFRKWNELKPSQIRENQLNSWQLEWCEDGWLILNSYLHKSWSLAFRPKKLTCLERCRLLSQLWKYQLREIHLWFCCKCLSKLSINFFKLLEKLVMK